MRTGAFVIRASAAAHARSAASVSDVWSVLADPQRWTEFEPFVKSVTLDPGARGDADSVAEGQRLRAQLRLLPAAVPVEVEHIVNRSSLAATVKLFPGLAEEVEHLLIPSATGGSVLMVRIRLHGPLALPALVPRWLARSLSVRLLARTAENPLRARSRQVSSVA
jgi:hypothetical protein